MYWFGQFLNISFIKSTIRYNSRSLSNTSTIKNTRIDKFILTRKQLQKKEKRYLHRIAIGFKFRFHSLRFFSATKRKQIKEIEAAEELPGFGDASLLAGFCEDVEVFFLILLLRLRFRHYQSLTELCNPILIMVERGERIEE